MKTEPTYEVTNYETLNKFLLGTLRDIRKKEINIEEAQAISQISDKIIKTWTRRKENMPMAWVLEKRKV